MWGAWPAVSVRGSLMASYDGFHGGVSKGCTCSCLFQATLVVTSPHGTRTSFSLASPTYSSRGEAPSGSSWWRPYCGAPLTVTLSTPWPSRCALHGGARPPGRPASRRACAGALRAHPGRAAGFSHLAMPSQVFPCINPHRWVLGLHPFLAVTDHDPRGVLPSASGTDGVCCGESEMWNFRARPSYLHPTPPSQGRH